MYTVLISSWASYRHVAYNRCRHGRHHRVYQTCNHTLPSQATECNSPNVIERKKHKYNMKHHLKLFATHEIGSSWCCLTRCICCSIPFGRHRGNVGPIIERNTLFGRHVLSPGLCARWELYWDYYKFILFFLEK